MLLSSISFSIAIYTCDSSEKALYFTWFRRCFAIKLLSIVKSYILKKIFARTLDEIIINLSNHLRSRMNIIYTAIWIERKANLIFTYEYKHSFIVSWNETVIAIFTVPIWFYLSSQRAFLCPLFISTISRKDFIIYK